MKEEETPVLINEEDYIRHDGVIRRSGRYPWGSGENPEQRSKTFLTYVEDLRAQGVPDKVIYEGLGMKSNEFRQRQTIATKERSVANITHAMTLKEAGMNPTSIGKEMEVNESVVRGWLAPDALEKAMILKNTTGILKDRVDQVKYLDIGEGTENHLGVSSTLLQTSVRELTDQGYQVYAHKEPQIANPGQFTRFKVLGTPDSSYKEMKNDPTLIKTVVDYTEDKGRSFSKIEAPTQLDSKRLAVRYKGEGGETKDGVIELRRDVKDISLDNANYAQVRIGVDGTHFIKGMAVYSDKMPHGVDVIFNTNKERTASKHDALKKVEDEKSEKYDPDTPFGSVIRQKHYEDPVTGERKLSILNIVGSKDGSGEEGSWGTWSHDFSSQFLSKQSQALAKQQLGIAYDKKKDQLEDIMSLTNPVLKKKLLDSYAESADSDSVHLKAAGLPRTANHVILPINSLKDNEVYAPWYNNGEKVVLVRHPHGGIFEIPELIVNNKNREANAIIKQAKDAVGINSKVAERLSGADFDGDTVLVIPQRDAGTNKIKTHPQLAELKNFDPRSKYKGFEGMKVMTPRVKQNEMGKISNLIADMTIGGASHAELARAVKHSMVVIDAEKHKLNYKQSELDNRIKELKADYQGGSRKGAATIISRAKGETTIPERRRARAAEGGPTDPLTGKKNWVNTGETYQKFYKKVNGERVYFKEPKTIPKTVKSKQMLDVDDARKLISKGNTPIENVYADHANKLKALANQARKTALSIKPDKVDKSAKTVYKAEIDSLKAKLNVARKNSPLERQAVAIANTQIRAKKQANPDMEDDRYKKIKYQEQKKARARVGAESIPIHITDREWEAIQSGAITSNLQRSIFNRTNSDQLKKLAMPRDVKTLSPTKMARARNLLRAGHTQAEIARDLGIPSSTLSTALQSLG